MTRKGTQLFTLIVVLFLALAVGCTVSDPQPDSNLTILHTNDLEGTLDPCSCLSDPAGGAARRGTAIAEKRLEDPDLILVDAGDALFGNPITDATAGQAQVAVMNVLGYDAATLGDRDFLYGLPTLQRTVSEANFPFLSANVVRTETGEPLTQPSVVLERSGLTIAVLGLTSPDVSQLVAADPGMRVQLRVLDPIETAKQMVPRLAREADVVIILSHLGAEMDRTLIKKVPGIAAIIGGHDREVIAISQPSKETPLVQVGYQGDLLGVLRLQLNSSGKTSTAVSANIRLDSAVESDPEVMNVLMPYKARAVFIGDLLASQGLSVLMPLEIHRASQEIQRAYLGALAYPDLYAGDVLSPAAGEQKMDLLSCFLTNRPADQKTIEFSLTALDHPDCVRLANDRLNTMVLEPQPVRVLNSYWSP